MDKFLDTMDKALTKVQKQFHTYVEERKSRNQAKKQGNKRIYIGFKLEPKTF